MERRDLGSPERDDPAEERGQRTWGLLALRQQHGRTALGNLVQEWRRRRRAACEARISAVDQVEFWLASRRGRRSVR